MGEMRPLFTGEFCPRDCDRRTDVIPELSFAYEIISVPARRLPPLVYRPFIPFIYQPNVPLIISNVLVEPKPMELPKGLLFYMDIKYDFGEKKP
jgi:hypothetical protein